MSETIITKRCCTCKQFKSLSEFYKSQRKDGLQGSCKDCQKIYQKRDRQSKKGKAAIKRYNQSEKGKAARKRYAQSEKGKTTQKRFRHTDEYKAKKKVSDNRYQQSEKGKNTRKDCIKRYKQSEKGKAYYKRYYKQYPERIAARKAVREAIRDGRLPRPNSLQCSCGEPTKHYHHHKGYAPKFWLDVVPLCRKCHSKIPHTAR